MTHTSKALSTIADDHLLECFMMAVEMDLDLEFVVQLRTEVKRRKLSLKLDPSQLEGAHHAFV
jgi:hypothetical protein